MINNYCTKVVQLLIFQSNLLVKLQISETAYQNVTALIKNNNGFYVVLSIIKIFIDLSKKLNVKDLSLINELMKCNRLPKDITREKNRFHKKIIKNFQEISMDKYGCCFIQKYYKLVENSIESFRFNIMEQIFQNTTLFIKHKYAHFIIQFLIMENNKKYIDFLIELVSYSCIEYCCDEISSRIIEKLISSNEIDCDKFVISILNSKFQILFLNKNGNKSKQF